MIGWQLRELSADLMKRHMKHTRKTKDWIVMMSVRRLDLSRERKELVRCTKTTQFRIIMERWVAANTMKNALWRTKGLSCKQEDSTRSVWTKRMTNLTFWTQMALDYKGSNLGAIIQTWTNHQPWFWHNKIKWPLKTMKMTLKLP